MSRIMNVLAISSVTCPFCTHTVLFFCYYLLCLRCLCYAYNNWRTAIRRPTKWHQGYVYTSKFTIKNLIDLKDVERVYTLLLKLSFQLSCSLSTCLKQVLNHIVYLCTGFRAFVTPVFKKGSRSYPSNYRPISLTCTCCCVMKRIINATLLGFSMVFFASTSTTCSNLLETVNDWYLALDTTCGLMICTLIFRKHLTSFRTPNSSPNMNLIMLEVNYCVG